jgi:hypothetical protein
VVPRTNVADVAHPITVDIFLVQAATPVAATRACVTIFVAEAFAGDPLQTGAPTRAVGHPPTVVVLVRRAVRVVVRIAIVGVRVIIQIGITFIGNRVGVAVVTRAKCNVADIAHRVRLTVSLIRVGQFAVVAGVRNAVAIRILIRTTVRTAITDVAVAIIVRVLLAQAANPV